jgi:hypothetical protein
MASVDVWNIVAFQERMTRSIEKMWRLNLVKRTLKSTLFVAYCKVSNFILKSMLKAKVRTCAYLSWNRKRLRSYYVYQRVIPLDRAFYASFTFYGIPWTDIR